MRKWIQQASLFEVCKRRIEDPTSVISSAYKCKATNKNLEYTSRNNLPESMYFPLCPNTWRVDKGCACWKRFHFVWELTLPSTEQFLFCYLSGRELGEKWHEWSPFVRKIRNQRNYFFSMQSESAESNVLFKIPVSTNMFLSVFNRFLQIFFRYMEAAFYSQFNVSWL